MAAARLWISSEPGDGPANEDRAGAAGNAVWVLDGASGLRGHKMPGASDAAWFSGAIDQSLRHILKDTPHLDTPALLRAAIGDVAGRYRQECGGREPAPHEVPSAAIIVARDWGDAIELAALGDCRALYRADFGAVEEFGDNGIDALESQTLSDLAAFQRTNPSASVAQAKDFLLPRLRANRRRMNQADGYWILSLDAAAIDHLVVRTVPFAQRVDCLLASDGLLRLSDLFDVYSAAELLEVSAREGGLADLMRRLRELESQDPFNRSAVRVKTRDDATGLFIGIERPAPR